MDCKWLEEQTLLLIIKLRFSGMLSEDWNHKKVWLCFNKSRLFLSWCRCLESQNCFLWKVDLQRVLFKIFKILKLVYFGVFFCSQIITKILPLGYMYMVLHVSKNEQIRMISNKVIWNRFKILSAEKDQANLMCCNMLQYIIFNVRFY